MPISDPLDILLLHDQWATRQILHACQTLTPEQFSQAFDIGAGSLRATITHIIGAMNTWNDTLAVRPLRPRPEESGIAYTPVQLLEFLDQAAAERAALAKSHPLHETVWRRVRSGKEYLLPRGAILTHVTTHGMHHRAQCLNMLKRLGVHPLPLSSVMEWSVTVNNGA